MKGFARWIVKHRIFVLILAVLLLIPSVFGMMATHINYDILNYLPENLDSVIGERYLEDDYKLASTATVSYTHLDVYKRQLQGYG